MRLTHRMIYGVAVSTLAIALGVTTAVRARGDSRPAPTDVAFAQTVSDLMVNELVAALFQEFKESTPDNIEHGKQAISLIFNDLNRDMRLIGTFRPLLGGENDRPAGSFETRALQLALTGQAYTAVQKTNDTWSLPAIGSPEQHVPHGVCALSFELHPRVLPTHQQPGPVGRSARGGRADQVRKE